MALQIVFIACAAAVALADFAPLYRPHPPPSYHPAPVHYPDTPPKYEYHYDVADTYSGNNYEASEKRNGYNTEGRYVVDLPDGRTQIVSYVDKGHGLLADVKYEGEAKHPVYVPPPSYPSHPPPHPTYG